MENAGSGFSFVRDGRSSAVVSVPVDGSGDAYAEELCRFLADRWEVAPPPIVRGSPEARAGIPADIIALGCLTDNPLIRDQYLRFRTLVDRWYPGQNGYVLHTLPAASPTESPVLIAGAGNGRGIGLAVERLIAHVAALTHPGLDWLLDVKLGAEHVPIPEDRIDILGTSSSAVTTPESAMPEHPYTSGFRGGNARSHLLRLGMYGPHANNSHFSRSSQLGLRYLYTGRVADGFLYRDALLTEIRLGVVRHLYHYKSVRMFQLWEALCPSPIFSADDRRVVEASLLEYVTQGTGVAVLDHIRAASVVTKLFDRHLACDALNLRIGADLFFRRTGDPEWLRRRDVADEYFRAQVGTDVPYTGLTEGYCSYLEIYLEWMQNACPSEIRRDPHIRLWAERVLGLCTNRGTLVTGAQTEETRYGYNLLRKLAMLLEDGRFLWAADMRERCVARGMDQVGQFGAGQAYAGDVSPVVPNDLVGIRVFPMNERLRRWQAPEIPQDHGFDRIQGRSGWSLHDEYFMLVGVRGGAKQLPTVGALAAFEGLGVRWIASPVLALRAEENSPTGYSVVTVTVNGQGAGLPAGATLVGKWHIGEYECVTTRVLLEGVYQWWRTVCWRPAGFMLIRDRVVMLGNGAYGVSANWRCAGPMVLEGPLAWRACLAQDGLRSRFFAETDASGWQYEPHCQRPVDARETDPMVLLPTLHAVADAHTEERRDVCLHTLLHGVREEKDARFRLTVQKDGRPVVVSQNEAVRFGSLTTEEDPVVDPVPKPKRARHAPAPKPYVLPSSAGKPVVTTVMWECECASPPSAWAVTSDHTRWATGCSDGSCAVYDGDGSCLWQTTLPSAITALTFLGRNVVVGTAEGTVGRYGDNGSLRWEHRCGFRPERDFWSWWFLRTPYIGGIAASPDPSSGCEYVAIGTGSCALNILDAASGRVVNDVISPYGLADVVRPEIVSTADGTPGLRFFVAHSDLTCSSAVRAWPPHADNRDGVRYDAVCGTDDGRTPGWDMSGVVDFWVGPLNLDEAAGDVLIVLRHGTHNQLAAYDLESTRPLWVRNLGGRPVSLVNLPGAGPAFAVAERFGWVSFFGPDGDNLGAGKIARRLEQLAPVGRDRVLAWGPEKALVGCAAGEWRPVRMEGTPLGWSRMEEATVLVVHAEESLRVVATKDD